MTTRSSTRRSSMGIISPTARTMEGLYSGDIERARSGSSDDTSVMDLNLIMGLHRQGAFDGEDARLYPPSTSRRPKRRNSLGATVRQPRAARTAELYHSNHTFESMSSAGTSPSVSNTRTPVISRRKDLARTLLNLSSPLEPSCISSPSSYSFESSTPNNRGSSDDQESVAGRSGVSKRKMTKLEKIQELQDKVEKTKEVARKSQIEKLEFQRELNEKKLEAASLEKELNTSVNEIETLRQELSYALQQLEALGKEQRKDRVKILKLTQELSSYSNGALRNGHRADPRDLEEEIQAKDQEIKRLVDTLEKHVKRCKSLQLDLETARDEIRELRGSHGNKKDENDRALAEIEKELGRSIQDNKAIREELDRVNDLAKSDELERQQLIEELTKENEALRRGLANQIETANSAKGATERVQGELRERQHVIDDLTKQNHELKKEILCKAEAVRSSTSENEHTRSTMRELQSTIDELEAHNKNLRRELAAKIEAAESMANGDEKSRAELMDRQQLIDDMEQEIEELRNNFHVQMDAARAAHRDKEKALSELRERDSLIEELDKEIEELKKLSSQQGAEVQSIKSEKERVLSDLRERDTMIDELMKENDKYKRKLSDQSSAIRSSSTANENLRLQLREQETQIQQLEKENSSLRSEVANEIESLQSTIKRNESALHERDALIDELEKEIDALKNELAQQVEAARVARTEQVDSVKEEANRLKVELEEKQTALEEAQRRNAILEEENEEFIMRHADLENELEFMSGELEQWKTKAEQNTYADGSSRDAVAQQELLLKAAIAQKNLTKRSWGPRISLSHISSIVNGSSDDGSDEKERTIRQLESANADHAETIKSLKSELVRMNSTYKEEAYVNKKKVKELADDNAALACKVAALEQQLAEVNGGLRGDLMMRQVVGVTPVTPT